MGPYVSRQLNCFSGGWEVGWGGGGRDKDQTYWCCSLEVVLRNCREVNSRLRHYHEHFVRTSYCHRLNDHLTVRAFSKVDKLTNYGMS